MFQRPLIPLLIGFIGGLLTGHIGFHLLQSLIVPLALLPFLYRLHFRLRYGHKFQSYPILETLPVRLFSLGTSWFRNMVIGMRQQML